MKSMFQKEKKVMVKARREIKLHNCITIVNEGIKEQKMIHKRAEDY